MISRNYKYNHFTIKIGGNVKVISTTATRETVKSIMDLLDNSYKLSFASLVEMLSWLNEKCYLQDYNMSFDFEY